MRALDRKLFRDLVVLRGQVVTIAAVVAAGVAAQICLQSTWHSLHDTRAAYYESSRFGDVFATLERAPRAVAAQLEAIPGVATTYVRLVEHVTVPADFLEDPASGQIVSIPVDGSPPLGALTLLSGRLPDPRRDDEVMLIEAFATAHEVALGDTLPVILHGRRRPLRVVGIGTSPEYVVALDPSSAIPGATYCVMWMPEPAVAAAFGREGAFDSVVLRLHPSASEAGVLRDVDRVLERYGGRGAIPRRLQASEYFLEGELAGLEGMATVVPVVFLAVAAFLLNVVLARLVFLQRGQIAALKANGYSNFQVGLHYLEFTALVVLAGSVVGVAVGAWLGQGMTDMYVDFFRFPMRTYQLTGRVVSVGILLSLGSAMLGALMTVRSVVKLPPAEALRPPAPTQYRATWLSRGPLARLFETSGRMVLREIERQPLRLLLSSLGIAWAVAILVVGRFSADALEVLIAQQFEHAMREDVAVSFIRPVPQSVVRELGHLPGVTLAEGMRSAAVRIRVGARHRDAQVLGHDERRELRVLVDQHDAEVVVPRGGVVLTRKLAEILGARVGEDVQLEFLEGERAHRAVRVVGFVDESVGLQAHMHEDALRALLREERSVNTVLLRVAPGQEDGVRRRLRDMPGVAGITRRQAVIESFRAQSGESMRMMTVVVTFFAAIIAIGVVYNNARVALSLRARDLASLRVLGFTRGEISGVLMGELAVQVLLAIPIGLWLGGVLSQMIMATADPERYRLGAEISGATYAFASLVTLAAGMASALLVRRRLDKLDLIAVLKTRE